MIETLLDYADKNNQFVRLGHNANVRLLWQQAQ